MEDDQADTLDSGDVSKFSELVDFSQLAGGATTPEPQPTGYSARWYVSRLHPGAGQVINDGSEGNFHPTLLENIQPDAVYVPTDYSSRRRLPLTWIAHSLEVNYNEYGGYDPQLIQQRDSSTPQQRGSAPPGGTATRPRPTSGRSGASSPRATRSTPTGPPSPATRWAGGRPISSPSSTPTTSRARS
jgi:hypothetical protein